MLAVVQTSARAALGTGCPCLSGCAVGVASGVSTPHLGSAASDRRVGSRAVGGVGSCGFCFGCLACSWAFGGCWLVGCGRCGFACRGALGGGWLGGCFFCFGHFNLGCRLHRCFGGCLGLQLLYVLVEFVDAGNQGFDILGRRHAQFVQGAGHAILKNAFQFVPLAVGFGGDVVGHGCHAAGGIGDALFGHSLGFALNRQTFFDQTVECFASLLLGFGKSTQTCQPDLLGRVFHGTGQWAGAASIGLLLGRGFLQFFDHDGLRLEWG